MDQIGVLIDQLQKTKKRHAQQNDKLNAIKDEVARLEAAIIEAMEAQGVTRSASENAAVAISRPSVPSVVDWDQVYGWILSTGNIHLLERRVSVQAFRDYLEQGGNIPGIEKFVKTKLSMRTL